MRILEIDIETAPAIAYIWQLRTRFVPVHHLVKDGHTLCFAAKWYKKPGVIFKSIHKDGKEDMLSTAHTLLEEADAVVHYNGSKFDIPVLNAEFMEMGIAPPAPSNQIDLYKTVRQRFKLTSNKLDFVANRLGLGGKVKHKGMEMWHECMAGNEAAWKTMERYNRRDVLLLERVYKKLLPWITNHPNMALYKDNNKRPICPSCGSHHLQSRGLSHTKTMTYRRFQCQSCGTWMRERVNNTTVDQKKNTLVGIK